MCIKIRVPCLKVRICFVWLRSILWVHWYPLFQTSEDSAAHGSLSQGGLIVACAFVTCAQWFQWAISGCWDWHRTRSPVRQAKYHCANPVRPGKVRKILKWVQVMMIPSRLWNPWAESSELCKQKVPVAPQNGPQFNKNFIKKEKVTYCDDHTFLFGDGPYAAEERYGNDNSSTNDNDPWCHRH